MKQNVGAYLTGLIVMVALDAGWLLLIGPSLYWSRIGEILLDKPVVWASVAYYLVYQMGVLLLAVRPGIHAGSISVATVKGAVLGFTAYATYDLTNNATLKIWSETITMADIAWGTVLTAIAATAACAAGRRLA